VERAEHSLGVEIHCDEHKSRPFRASDELRYEPGGRESTRHSADDAVTVNTLASLATSDDRRPSISPFTAA
jgi:hypothetical protein